MSVEHEFFGLRNRQEDIATLREMIRITNIGVQAVTEMYDDHSRDTKVQKKMFLMQESVVYRISAVLTQYELLIEGIKRRATLDLKLHPFSGPIAAHPIIYQYSCELSSMVDNVFFHLCSVFDYMGHFISYIFLDNKNKTLDWDSLAKTARGKWKDSSQTSLVIQAIDAKIRKKLDQYRSELIHRSRDNHMVGSSTDPDTGLLNLKFTASDDTMKYFRNLLPGYEDVVPAYKKEAKYTLDFLCSLVFYESLHCINAIFEFIRFDLLQRSTFRENLEKPKTDNPHPYLKIRGTHTIVPRSENIWADYYHQHEAFIAGLQKRWEKSMSGPLDL